MESEDYSDDSHVSTNDIDTFLSDSLDDIMDMYDEFKSRFSYDPFFLGYLQSTELTEFFTDILFVKAHLRSKSPQNSNVYDNFCEEYEKEISTSFAFAHPFLMKHDFNLAISTWALFCFKYSIIDYN
jgi:hypothetical protein